MNAALRIFAWLLAMALVALPVVAVLNGWIGAERWPLTKLRVHGEFQRVDPAQLRMVVLPYAKRGFFAVRLQDAQDAVEKLAWVDHAEVRKRWPDVMEIHIVEHKPFARWGEGRLLSEQGRLFPTPKALTRLKLPQLGGPDSQVQEVIALYNESRQLFAPMGLEVERLVMDRRGSWSLTLGNGTEVVIGRADARPRLGRFARMLPQLLTMQSLPLLRADLRYTNGFALSWGSEDKQQGAGNRDQGAGNRDQGAADRERATSGGRETAYETKARIPADGPHVFRLPYSRVPRAPFPVPALASQQASNT